MSENCNTETAVGKDVESNTGDHSEQEFEWIDEATRIKKQKQPVRSRQLLKLHFVSETGTARPGGVSRNLIRSHARRDNGQASDPNKQHLFTTKPSGAGRPEVPTGDAPVNQKRRPHTEPSTRGKSILIKLPSPSTIILEPFDSLPVGSSRHMQALLNHWDTVFRHSFAPASPREKWLPFAVSDALVLNTTLLITALNLCGLRGYAIGPDVLYYQGNTIRLINERLSNSSLLAADSTICAVASMAHLENLAGTPESSKMHIDGLEAMVKSRGGFDTIRKQSIARRIAAWADSCAAVVLQTKLRFELADVRLALSHVPNKPATQSVQKLTALTGSSELSIEAVSMYCSLYNLMRLKDITPKKLVGDPNFGDIQESLERRLVALIQHTPRTEVTTIFEIFGNAALIHCYGFMRDLALTLPFFNLLSLRIYTTITSSSTSSTANLSLFTTLKLQYPELLLWILIIAGIGGAPPQRRWYARAVAEFASELGVKGGDEIASYLEGFLWTELYRTPATVGFWGEVDRGQGARGRYAVKKVGEGVAMAIFNVKVDGS